ncbi:TonB-dependent siderophore receptor [Corticibacter populi]|uniref:TonB-dependent siderophore receptor n=1 Tax=Corticibacter populi TaxID=1550736 RepID=A0A3M6R0C3_9BURK|nr:TonB-dependent siderophore receptor [Corticibacter populi]RMX08252.1 TonB-dependent siderophore receptor [Corticibacter populi]RZS35525.1 outer membrane receptor for ferric coprogen and ferric-rhodotorulic acid [Corticibacter populi]
MHAFNRRHAVAIATAALLTSHVGLSWAQTTVTTLPEVAVTADTPATDAPTESSDSYTQEQPASTVTKLPLTQRETPQSYTVITRQRIDDQALDTLGDVLEQTPGISVDSGGPLVGSYIGYFSRGYQITNYQIDGAISHANAVGGSGGWTSISSLDTAIYDSITVLRGASGLLSGSGDPGGSISLVRKRPTREFQGALQQSLSRWQQARTVADFGGSLNQAGSLRARVVGAYDQGKSWVDRYEADKHTVYGVLEADLSHDTLLRLAAEHNREDGKNAAAFTAFETAFTDGTATPFGRSDNALTDWSRYESDRTSLAATLEHRFNDDWQARASVNHSRYDNSQLFGYAGVRQPSPDGTADLMIRFGDTEQTVDTVDASLSGTYALWGRSHDLMAGVNGSDSKADSLGSATSWAATRVDVLGWDGSYALPDLSAVRTSDTRTEIKQWGAYLATRLRPRDDLAIIVGGRLSEWETTRRNLQTGAITDDRKESTVFTPYAGVVFDLNDQLSAYASYSTIFNPQSYEDVNGNVLDPEEGKNYELGLKGEWWGGRLNTSAAVFEVRKDNLAIADGSNLTPDGGQAYTAADQTKGRGWELEASGEIARGVQLQGGYTRVVTRASDGTRLNTVRPKHQLKLFGTWAPSGAPGLRVGGGMTWQSEIYSSNASYANVDRSLIGQKSYAVVNLMAAYQLDDHWHFSLHLDNVFDKSYRTMVLGSARHTYGAPRHVSASVKYQF